MDLREYLFRKRISVTDFAKKIGCSRITISRISNGKNPSGKIALAIEKATNGQVTVEELLNEK